MTIMKSLQGVAIALAMAGGAYGQYLVDPPTTADPSTTNMCSNWAIAASADVAGCKAFATNNGVAWSDFHAWNPEVKASCAGMISGNSYCIEYDFGIPPVSTTTAPTTLVTSTVTSAANVPSPTQSGQIASCNHWDLVNTGNTCSTFIAKYSGLTLALLYSWNPAIGTDCTGLWADTYLCTGVTGWSPTTTGTVSITSTANAGNGISTPSPIQTGEVNNCNKWYFVQTGDSCAPIAANAGIPLASFYKWNPAIGSDCSALWANTYVCVGTTTFKPSTTLTTSSSSTTTLKASSTVSGNGIVTPSPIQTGQATNCKKWYFVKTGDSCSAIASANQIPLDKFYKWNPAVNTDCSALWANTYVCVLTTAYVASTTTTQPATTTTISSKPSPTQTGQPANCNKWHFVATGETCDTIAKQAGITSSQFLQWNPAAGSSCTGLWAATYACIGISS